MNNKPILFLSPINWNFPNRLIQEFAKSLSISNKLLFLGTFVMEPIPLKSLIQKSKKRNEFYLFLKKLVNHEQLISETLFITFRKYNAGDEFLWFDSIFFLFQLKLYFFLMTGRIDFTIWTTTTFFPKALKRLNGTNWVFDFFDRSYDFSSESNNQLYRSNEKWLLDKAKLIFINSEYYLKVVRSIVKSPEVVQRIKKVPVGNLIDEYLSEDTSSQKKSKSKKQIVVGYEGGISSRMDFQLIESTVAQNPEIKFVFLGKTYENAFWMSPYSKEPIATFIKRMSMYKNFIYLKSEKNRLKQIEIIESFTIGWIPYDLGIPFNFSCNPTKFYEYCAVGIPVLSTKIPSLIDHKEAVYFISTAADFKLSLKKALTEVGKKEVEIRKKVAINNNTDEKAVKVFSILKLHPWFWK